MPQKPHRAPRALAASARTIKGCNCSVRLEEGEAFGGAGQLCRCGILYKEGEAFRGARGSVSLVRRAAASEEKTEKTFALDTEIFRERVRLEAESSARRFGAVSGSIPQAT